MNDEMDEEKYLLWLRSVQPGQPIAIERNHFGSGRVYDVLKISRLTPSMLVCDVSPTCSRKFDRKTGKEKGVERRWHKVRPITKEIVEANELRSLRYWWETVADKHRNLDLATLRAVKAAFEKATWELKEPV